MGIFATNEIRRSNSTVFRLDLEVVLVHCTESNELAVVEVEAGLQQILVSSTESDFVEGNTDTGSEFGVDGRHGQSILYTPGPVCSAPSKLWATLHRQPPRPTVDHQKLDA
ncbi:hypothetical protein SCUP234_12148 [Seiridium cupressi]